MTDENLFKRGMRRLASGVSLVTTRDDDGAPHGMVATSVASVTTDPPSLLVCVNRTASCHGPMDRSGTFCVNFLREDDQEVAALFSSSKHRDVRFSRGDWRPLETGALALSSALASFDCRVHKRVEAGSHTIFIGEVASVMLWEEAISPLVYLDGAYTRCQPAV